MLGAAGLGDIGSLFPSDGRTPPGVSSVVLLEQAYARVREAGWQLVNADCVFVGPNFAWNHGDFQQDITRTWFAMVGPGVQPLGRNDVVFSDHADVRPTMLALLGLKDSYVHDGRVLSEWIAQGALPPAIRQQRESFVELAEAYKQLNAPLGELGRASLVYANRSITGVDKAYARYLTKINDITNERNSLASDIKTVLNAAAFGNQPVHEGSENGLGHRARALINRVKILAGGEDSAAN